MNGGTILNDELIFAQRDFSSAEEVITFLSGQLLTRGYVKEDFLPAVLKREKTFPTGIYLGTINVALPHTDAEHVLKPALAIVTLKSPVRFGKMDNPEEKISVHIVFLLAIVDPNAYVKFLSKLTSFFGNPGFTESIYSSQTLEEVSVIMNKALSGGS